jgi:chlorobactene glucosyltransferase
LLFWPSTSLSLKARKKDRPLVSAIPARAAVLYECGTEAACAGFSIVSARCGEDAIVEILVSCAWLAVVAGLIFRALHQPKLFQVVAISPLPVGSAPRVAVIIPARDEEHNIGACLERLFAQDYPSDRFDVLLVDDHSSDRTVSTAEALPRRRAQLQVLSSPPLPPQWIGKSYACWVGAGAISEDTEWLCFLDADVQAESALLASTIAAAEADSLDLLSLSPRQRLGSFAERLMIPCGLYILAFCQDLQKLQSRQGNEVTATGQFMLIRRSVYDAVGGHRAVRSAICEDVALASAIKGAGGRVILRDGRELLASRMYTGWRTLWPGLAKNLVDMLGGPVSTIATAITATTLAWAACLIPFADALSCRSGATAGCLAFAPASAGSAAIFGLHIAGAFYFGVPLWYGLLFPVSYTAGALMSADSIRRRLRGCVRWKGRTYGHV